MPLPSHRIPQSNGQTLRHIIMRFLTFISCVFLMTASTSNPSEAANEKMLPLCKQTPNCVSSQASILERHHYIEPLKVKGDVFVAWQTLKSILEGQDRVVITHETFDSLHAEATSLMFRFVDDFDALLDKRASLIHVRSASRVGHHDFGVNRKRIEKLRKKMRAAGVVE